MPVLPPAILFDLDETILSAYGRPHQAWSRVAVEFAAEVAPLSPAELSAAIVASANVFWSDATQHKYWRHRLDQARSRVVAQAFEALARAGRPIPDMSVADRLARRFHLLREAEMCLFPGAEETLDRLKELGVKLALITNGAAEPQRAKVVRFALEHRFDHIQIEGEHGFGKPEERAYTHAMAALCVGPADCWMVGDNLEWEVEAPQRLGIYAIWCDAHGEGLPAGSAIRPDRIIRALPELLEEQVACDLNT
jgi:putative hydrolase of the HAD superfamily